MKRRRKDEGMTLIEVLISTLILVLGFLIIVSSFVAMARSNRYSEKHDKAIQLASRVMEDMRNSKFSDIQNENGFYYEYPEFPKYRHQINVQPTGRVKKVTVRIYFDDDQKHVSLVSYFANM